MNIEQIISYVDAGFWILLLLCILIAFLKGFKGSFNHLIGTIVVIILCLVLSNVLSKVLFNIDISGITNDSLNPTLSAFLKAKIAEAMDITIEAGSTIEEYITSLAQAIFRIPIYFILFIVGMLIIRPIIGLIIKFIIPIPKGKSFLGRTGGVGLELISFFLVIFFGLGMVFGVIGVAQDVVDYARENGLINQENLEENVSSNDLTIDQIEEYIQILETKPFFKSISLLSGKHYKLEIKLLGSLTKIKTSNGTINLIKEKDTILPVVSIYLQANKDDKYSIIQSFVDSKDVLTKALNNSQIFEVLMPVIVEIVDQKEIIPEIDYSKLKNINWKNEKNSLVALIDEILSIVGELELNDELFTMDSSNSILKNTNLPNYLKRIGIKLQGMSIITEVALDALDKVLDRTLVNSIPVELQDLKDAIKLSKLDLENDLEIAGYMINDIASIDGLSDVSLYKILSNKDIVNDLLTRLLSISVVNGNEEKIIKSFVNYLQTILNKDGSTFTVNYSNVTNYRTELFTLKDILIDLIDVLNDAGYESLENIDYVSIVVDSKDKDSFKDLVNKVCISNLLGENIIKLIDKLLEEQDLSSWTSQEFKDVKDGNKAYDASELESTINFIIEIISDIKSSNIDLTNIDFNTLSSDDIDTLFEIIKKMNQAPYISIDNLINYINDFSIEQYNIEVLPLVDRNNDGSNKDEWSVELDRLSLILKELINIDGFDEDSITTSSSTIGSLLDKMKQSYIFGNDTRCDGIETIDDDIFNKIIIELLTQADVLKTVDNPNGFIEEELAKSTDWTIYDYTTELEILSVYDITKEANEQSDEVIKQMSESQIVQDLFDVASFINEKIEGVSTTIKGQTIQLKDYVNGGNSITKEDMIGRNWIDEIDDAEEINRIFEESSSNTSAFKVELDALSNSDTNTLSVDASKKLKEHLIEIGIWDSL